MEELIEKLQGVLPPETCKVREQCIYKVPPRIRKAHPQVYTPQIISIGPFHNPRGRDANEDTNIFCSMEELKLKYLKGFLKRTELSVEKCFLFIKGMEDNIRNCYAGGPVIYNSNDFLRIIITDACFIIELFLRSGENGTQKENDPILSKPWLRNHIMLDMILLENQLPFFVLQDIYRYARLKSKFPSFIEITTCIFKGLFNQHELKIDTEGLSPKHFVDLLRIILKPSSLDLEQNEQETNPIRCCSQCTGNFKLNFCLPKNKEVQAVKKKKKALLAGSAAPTGDFELSFSLPKNKEEQETIPIQTPIQDPIECSSQPTGDFQLSSIPIQTPIQGPILCSSQPTGDFQLSSIPIQTPIQFPKACSSQPTGDFQLSSIPIQTPRQFPKVCSSQPTGDFELSFIPIQTPIQDPILCSSQPTGDFQLSFSLPKNKEEQETNRIDHVYSASQFSEAGLKFEVSKDYKSLLDLKFDDNKGVLKMPCFYVHDNTEVVFGNILAYEECHFPDSGYINQYMKILDFLINTEKDVSILIENGIIVNLMGDASSVATVITNLNKNIVQQDLNPNYLSLCLSLNAFYQNPLNKHKATFIHEYFNTPWKKASTIAAVLLILLTVTQTICSIWSLAKQ